MRTALLAAALAAVSFVPAFAEDTFRVEFTYNRAQAMTPAGAEAIYRSLRSELRDACGFEPGVRGLAHRRAVETCVDAHLDRAVDQLGSAHVAEAHIRRGGFKDYRPTNARVLASINARG